MLAKANAAVPTLQAAHSDVLTRTAEAAALAAAEASAANAITATRR